MNGFNAFLLHHNRRMCSWCLAVDSVTLQLGDLGPLCYMCLSFLICIMCLINPILPNSLNELEVIRSESSRDAVLKRAFRQAGLFSAVASVNT